MASILFTLLGVMLYSAILIDGEFVRVELFKEFNCEESLVTTEMEFLCTNLPAVGTQASGAIILGGSCAILHKESSCNGDPYMIAYPDDKLCTLPTGWNDHVLSVRDCDSEEVNIICPEGSFIRQVEYGDKHEGITVHCYKPMEDKPTYSENTHGNLPITPTIKGCPVAAHGFAMSHTTGWDMFHSPSLECSRPLPIGVPTENRNSTGSHYRLKKPKWNTEEESEEKNATLTKRMVKDAEIMELCNVGDALTGISVTVDEGGGIKEAGFHCTKVADPTTMCEPDEFLGAAIHCDNSAGSGELECSFSKTVGVGQASTMTEAERTEMTFFMQIGITIKDTIPGLSAKMSGELSYSELVEYEWSRTDTTTWTEESTISATVKVPPRTHSKLEQLIGKCSFYGTSVNYFKASDVNFVTGETTVKYFSI